MRVKLNIVIEKKDLELIKKIALKRGQRHSDFIILAIREKIARLGFLSKDESKALGIDN